MKFLSILGYDEIFNNSFYDDSTVDSRVITLEVGVAMSEVSIRVLVKVSIPFTSDDQTNGGGVVSKTYIENDKDDSTVTMMMCLYCS